MIRRRLLALFAAVAFVAAACGSDNDDSAPSDDEQAADDGQSGDEEVQGGDFVWGNVTELAELSPYPNNGAKMPLRTTIYDSLFSLDEDGQPVGMLAEQVEFSDDLRQVDLTLREGVTFHDGSPFDAEAVVWNLNRLLADDVATLGKDIFIDAEIEATDSMSVRITFPEATPLAAAILQQLSMVSPDADLDGGIGTGPFVVDEFMPGDSLRLVRNDDYWASPAKLDTVTMETFPDIVALVTAVESGAVDYMQGVPAADVPRLQSDESLRVEILPGNGQYQLAINPTRGCLTDQRFRKALSLAFDRERFVETSLQGFGTVQTQPFPPSSPVYSQSLNDEWTFDLQAAEALVNETSCDQVELLGRLPSPLADFLPVYAEDLASIGVTATIVEQDGSTGFESFSTSNFETITHSYGDADLDPSVLFTGNVFNGNWGSWADDPAFAEYSRLVSEAKTEVDPDRRTAMYQEIARLIRDQAFVITVANPQEADVFADHVQDAAFLPTSPHRLDLSNAWIAEE